MSTVENFITILRVSDGEIRVRPRSASYFWTRGYSGECDCLRESKFNGERDIYCSRSNAIHVHSRGRYRVRLWDSEGNICYDEIGTIDASTPVEG